jgi:K+-sensing histidine kinase KdpD
MAQYFLGGILAVIVLAMLAFTGIIWIFWREDRRENILSHIADYIRGVATRCEQLASACPNQQTKSGLEDLSLELVKKAAALQPDFGAGAAPPTERLSVYSSRWPLNLEAALMIVAESTVILLAIDYLFKLPPICVALAYFIPIVFIATRYGFVPATTGLVASALLLAFIFFPPRFSLYVGDSDQLIELLAFSGIGLVAIPIIATRGKPSMG